MVVVFEVAVSYTSVTLSTSKLPPDGSIHLGAPVNLHLDIDFFQVYLIVYTGESETLIPENISCKVAVMQ